MTSAMVWGASGGIGSAVVARLAASSYRVCAVSRHPLEHGALVQSLDADPVDEFAVRQAVLAAAQSVDQVSVWVYAAGDILDARIEASTFDEWTRIMNANLAGAFLATHHSLPLLADDAHLIYLGAMHERLRLPGYGAYAAAKAGMEAFATTLGKEQRRKRITVVRPAAVATALWDKVPLRLPPSAMQPAKFADHLMEIIRTGQTGIVDLPAAS